MVILPPCVASTVNSRYNGHCRDLEVVSSLARVRNSGSLIQPNVWPSELWFFFFMDTTDTMDLQHDMETIIIEV